MTSRVGVDDSLRPVKDRLRAGGYDVVSLAAGVPLDLEAVVVNGLDPHLLGRQDVATQVPIVNAAGRTPEDVAAEVAARLRRCADGPTAARR